MRFRFICGAIAFSIFSTSCWTVHARHGPGHSKPHGSPFQTTPKVRATIDPDRTKEGVAMFISVQNHPTRSPLSAVSNIGGNKNKVELGKKMMQYQGAGKWELVDMKYELDWAKRDEYAAMHGGGYISLNGDKLGLNDSGMQFVPRAKKYDVQWDINASPHNLGLGNLRVGLLPVDAGGGKDGVENDMIPYERRKEDAKDNGVAVVLSQLADSVADSIEIDSVGVVNPMETIRQKLYDAVDEAGPNGSLDDASAIANGGENIWLSTLVLPAANKEEDSAYILTNKSLMGMYGDLPKQDQQLANIKNIKIGKLKTNQTKMKTINPQGITRTMYCKPKCTLGSPMLQSNSTGIDMGIPLVVYGGINKAVIETFGDENPFKKSQIIKLGTSIYKEIAKTINDPNIKKSMAMPAEQLKQIKSQQRKTHAGSKDNSGGSTAGGATEGHQYDAEYEEDHHHEEGHHEEAY